MSDIADIAQNSIEVTNNADILKVLGKPFEKGFSGECDFCGYHKERLVNREYDGEIVTACGGCRDEFKLDA